MDVSLLEIWKLLFPYIPTSLANFETFPEHTLKIWSFKMQTHEMLIPL